MFTRPNIPTILQSAILGSDGERKLAFCKVSIFPFTYDLAQELHPDVADRLYRLNKGGSGWKNGEREFQPCLTMDEAKFAPILATIPPQRMEFRTLPEVPGAGTVIPNVELRSLQAILNKYSPDFTLMMGFRFEITNRSTAALYLVEQFRVTSFLTFQAMQKGLALEGAEEGWNERNQVGMGRKAGATNGGAAR
ncbi:MAG: hypothetical protein PHC88_05495 [Terrimicrobiaceae bacterium]|nr:hypothetical protein [Terrimicrobiaceae bacterium]